MWTKVKATLGGLALGSFLVAGGVFAQRPDPGADRVVAKGVDVELKFFDPFLLSTGQGGKTSSKFTGMADGTRGSSGQFDVAGTLPAPLLAVHGGPHKGGTPQVKPPGRPRPRS